VADEAAGSAGRGPASGVGPGPRPSEALDPDLTVQLLHDPLLWDGQDGVADWTEQVKGKHSALYGAGASYWYLL